MRSALTLLLLATAAATLTGCISFDLDSLLRNELEEITLEKPPRSTDDKILVIDIGGMIGSGDGGWFVGRVCSPAHVKAVLKHAEADEDVKALLLRIDSPGGRVTETDLIYHEIREYAERTGVPVYAAIVTLGCSGGYYIAMAADKVYAEPTAVTGSIGVMMILPKFKGLAGKIGYEHEIIKSGAMKDMGNPLRDMSDEERDVMQNVVDSLHTRFVDIVAENRKTLGDRDRLKELADGRIYTADQAKEAGLIDAVCHVDGVLADLRKQAGLERARVVMYAYSDNPDTNLYSPAKSDPGLPAPLVNVSLPDLPLSNTAGFFYLWMPGQR